MTECFLTNYKLPPPSSHLAGKGRGWRRHCLMKRPGNKKKREGERESETLSDGLKQGGFKGVVTCTYVSPGLILWMTCLHLGVITALLLSLCSTLFSSQFFWFITLEIQLPSTPWSKDCTFAVFAGSSFVFRTEPDYRQMCTWYVPQRLCCSPSVFTGRYLLQAICYWHVFTRRELWLEKVKQKAPTWRSVLNCVYKPL